jgi:tetratricopeptide (TPR) repeat protein
MKYLWPFALLAIFYAILLVRSVARRQRLLRDQIAAYQRGDYRRQIEIVEGFRHNGSEPPDYLFFYGGACLQLGRLAQAEQALGRSLAMEKTPSLRVIARNELGRVFMEQDRWEDAEDCFRKCIAEAPERGAGHRALAELLLRRGDNAQAAMAAAQRALDADRTAHKRRGELGKLDHDTSLAESLVFFAWAAAENRAPAVEVESALTEAFSLCGRETVPVLAELHYCAGHAYATLGNRAESAHHFQSAAELDPDGTYGRLARAVVTSNHAG